MLALTEICRRRLNSKPLFKLPCQISPGNYQAGFSRTQINYGHQVGASLLAKTFKHETILSISRSRFDMFENHQREKKMK